ncbi:MAG: patatin family protein [Alphaproteobacteria bacterium]|nr:patatin family protein [Alphaproteobacteria bacterium]
MSVALVLEGGAKRGIYTAGVLDVLLENGLIADQVVGVSAGAIHGASYVSGQIGRSIRYYMKHSNNYKFMSLRNWLLTGNVVDTKFCYYELPEILDPFDHDTFEKAKTKFYAVCSNIETGKAEYIHCTELRRSITYLRASASLPVFSKIVEIDGKKLLDGGICDSIPLEASQKMGFEKNVVVLTRPEGYKKKKSKFDSFSKWVYRKFPLFAQAIENRADMYNKQLEFVESEAKNSPNTLIIRPSVDLGVKRMEKDLGKVKAMYELGRKDALSILDNLKEFWKQS